MTRFDVEVLDGPDSRGRYTYIRRWWPSDGHPFCPACGKGPINEEGQCTDCGEDTTKVMAGQVTFGKLPEQDND